MIFIEYQGVSFIFGLRIMGCLWIVHDPTLHCTTQGTGLLQDQFSADARPPYGAQMNFCFNPLFLSLVSSPHSTRL